MSNLKQELSPEQMQLHIDKLASNGITVDGSNKLDQNKSIMLYPEGTFFDFGSDKLDGDDRESLYYHDVEDLLKKRPSLKNAPVQAKGYKPSRNYTKPDVDSLTATHKKLSAELEEFSELEEPSLLKMLDEFLPADWFKEKYPDCMGYRADGVKTLTVSTLDSDGKAQAVCYRRDRKSVLSDTGNGERILEEIKWRTDGSKKFIPSKLTGKGEVYLASGMGELIMLELLDVDYICIQSDGMAKHLIKPKKEEIKHLIILPDQDESFMKTIDTILGTLQPIKASIAELGYSDPRDAAKALKTRSSFMSAVNSSLKELEIPESMVNIDAIAEVKTIEVEDVAIEAKEYPINPNDFSQMMQDRMLELNPEYKLAKNASEAFYSFGASFNNVACRNRDRLSPKRIVVPLSTGSGKTVSAKLHLATGAQRGISGMLVVSEISTALDAVREINALAGAEVAGAYYKPSEDNPDCDSRYELTDLPLIAVISHSMFISRSYTGIDINLLKYYDGEHRKTIIIDESINLVRSSSFGSEEVPDLISILDRDEGLHKYTNALSIVIGIFDKENNIAVTNDSVMQEMLDQIIQDTTDVIEKIRTGTVSIRSSMRSKKDAREREMADVISLLERITFVFGDNFVVTAEGKNKVIHRDIDLSGAFGSVVILDATSTINPSYTFHQHNSDNIQFIERTNVRSYANVTLNNSTSKNFTQSKTALYHSPKRFGLLDNIIDQYLNAIKGINEPGDKILVCTFKILIPLFKHRNTMKNIEFIHYGSSAARGSNEFNDFNKAVAIGFYRRPQSFYNGTVMSVNSYENYIPTNYTISDDALQLKNHLIVDDLIQFFNRIRCRVSIDVLGNCKETDLYLFTGGGKYLGELLEKLIRNEMPDIKTKIWEVNADQKLIQAKKKNKLYEVAENVVEWMLTVSREYDNVSQANIIEYFGFSKHLMKRLKKEPHFKHLCEEHGIFEFKEGRSFIFHLP